MKVKRKEKQVIDNYESDEELSFKEPSHGKKVKLSFSNFISRVGKEVHPNLGISKGAMQIFESFTADFFERICTESSRLMEINSKKVIKTQDIVSAIKLMMPGELGKHAILEAENAMSLHSSN